MAFIHIRPGQQVDEEELKKFASELDRLAAFKNVEVTAILRRDVSTKIELVATTPEGKAALADIAKITKAGEKNSPSFSAFASYYSAGDDQNPSKLGLNLLAGWKFYRPK
jgi:hypothetical protein